LRGIKGRVVAVLVGLILAVLGPAAASAGAEVLVNQPPGPSGFGVQSDGVPDYLAPYDDFIVPLGTHWHAEAIRVFGIPATERPRTFTVRIYSGGGQDDSPPYYFSGEELFKEQVTVDGGPSYLIPIEGAPRFDPDAGVNQPGYFWISVQTAEGGEEAGWSWLTAPDTPGTGPAYWIERESKSPPGETGMAFQLFGTATQSVKAQVTGQGTLISDPPGISCPGTCSAEFPRGTALTFTQTASNPATKFVEWGFRNTGYSGPSNALSPIVIPSPCGGTAGCSFNLTSDTNVGAVFEPNDEIDVLRVARERRAGKGQLLVWVPGPGQLTLFSEGLRNYFPGGVAGGLVRVPLIPTKKTAKTLRRAHHVTVSAEVSYRPTGASVPSVTELPLTLVRKQPQRPGHKPAHRVH
jgi:hypothetical protein